MKSPRAIKSSIFLTFLLVVLGMLVYSPRTLRRNAGARSSNALRARDVRIGASGGFLEPFALAGSRLRPAGASPEMPVEADERLRGRVQGVRVPFVANAGQIDPAVAYYAPTFAGTVYVTQEGQIVYSLPGGGKTSASGVRSAGKRTGWSLTETPVGGRGRPRGIVPASAGVSYFFGNDPTSWRTSLPTFEALSLGDIWPGISLELQARGKNVEKLFTVEPGGDPSRIRMNVAGARRLRVNEAGALVAGTDLGEITFTPPDASQERRGVRHPVRVAYELHGKQYGFRLDDYDPALPVLIDPSLQSTYLGGSGNDVALALAIHPTTGDIYVAGSTDSTDFPGTAGGAQTTNAGGSDAFVARLSADLKTLKQATYLGGSGMDEAFALAIQPITGDVYVAGLTQSTNFPGTAGGAQAANGGGDGDLFIARLNAALTSLDQATYLGGSGFDEPLALAIRPTTGDVYVAGFTTSTDFPGTAGGAQAANGGGIDGFVARLNAALTTLGQATYLGSNSTDDARALAIHPTSGEVYVAGYTYSTDFPKTAGGAQSGSSGGSDAFVARLNAALTTLTQATYLGGSKSDFAVALAIYPTTGDLYVAGFTDSTNFPGTAGGAQAANNGGEDAFVARFNAALTVLTQATYLGGSGLDEALALAIHPTSGDVYVAGQTFSTDFPGTAGGAQPAIGGGDDAFVARLNAALTTLTQATYLGGSGTGLEFAAALAFDRTTGDVCVAGTTDSTNFPGTAGGAQPVNGGDFDAFVARLSADLTPGAQLTELSPAKVWIGLRNSDDVGIAFDLQAKVYLNGAPVGSGQLTSVRGGSSGFNNAKLDSIPLTLAAPVSVSAGDMLRIDVLVRNACSGSGKNSGSARLWYNGQPLDSGKTRDAGSRFDATIGGTSSDYFLRGNSALSTTAGTSRLFVDKPVGKKCGAFVSFGSWTTAPLTADSRPVGITLGPDGALWFTEFLANRIGRITTAGVITNEFPIPP